jgi:hypothetical protein
MLGAVISASAIGAGFFRRGNYHFRVKVIRAANIKLE